MSSGIAAMSTARKIVGLVLISVKPGFLVLGILGILVLVIVAWVVYAAVNGRDKERRKDAQTVLRILFRKEQK